MTMKLIRSEADYDEALSRLEELMGARAGTPEGDELELLSTLIEHYEEERFPIEAPTPLAAIRFRMEQEDLSPRDLEPYIGSRARVSEVLSGERALSIDMIRALHQHLGIPAESLIRPEPVADTGPVLEPSRPVLKLLSQWKVLNRDELYGSFLSRACGSAPAVAMLRKTRTERTNAKTDPAALQAWCASVLVRSNSCSVEARFQAENLDFSTVRQIARLSVREDGPRAVRSALSDLGIAFVVLPHLPGTHLDGAAMTRGDGRPIIALTLRHDRIDNFWFTLLHELAHVRKHLSDETFVIFDDLDLKSTETREQEADELAEVALVPDELWEEADLGVYASTEQILALATRAGVNPAIVAGRWQRQHKDFRKFSRLLGRGTLQRMFADELP